MARLLNGRIFNPEITGHLEQGHDQARESLRRIDGGDTPAAREPAAVAARELQAAADAMNRVGEEQAKLQLADAQHALNEAADQARDASRQNGDAAARERAERAAEQARQAARDLAAQAQAQQDTGSSEAAKRLNDLASALSAPETRNALEKLRAQPLRPRKRAGRRRPPPAIGRTRRAAAQPGPLSTEELARLVERLERDRANLQRLALNDPGCEGRRRPAKTGPDPGLRPDGNAPSGQEKPGDQREGNSPDQPSQDSKPSEEKQGQGQPGQEGKTGDGKQGQEPGQGQSSQAQTGPGTGEARSGPEPSKVNLGRANRGRARGRPGQGQGQG